MAGVLEEASHKAQRAAVSLMVDKILKDYGKEREQAFVDIVELAEKFIGKNNNDKFEKAKKTFQNPNSRWTRFLNQILDEANPNFIKTVALNLGYEAFLRGTKTIRENREKYNCNIPWLILFDPTSACNMHCAGCWSGTYGHKYSLTYDEMDRIVTQGKELGTYLYFMTGGEPLVRKKDILKLAEKHNDCMFGLFSNSTFIDEDLCKELVRLGNITFLLSIEGTRETNDGRRGDGHYEGVMKAMDLLKKYGIVFGTSICYTSANIEAVTNDEFIQMISDKGARFGFYFHYMPVGTNAVPSLMPTIEQRKYMINRIRELRSEDSKTLFYPMDFQNDGEFVGGCIAGGRNYFHINSAGDAEPCVFIHYSDANIRDKSILEILQSPLFMAYRDGQPFNHNHLRPCPMLENPELLRKMVKDTGAQQTNLESPEEVDDLCDKCEDYAETWAPAAEEEWALETHHKKSYVNYKKENIIAEEMR